MGAWLVTRPLSEPSSPISVVALTPGSSRGLLPLISPVNMELRTILPAVLCISAACLQAACGAAPRRGPKVTEKVGADAALACVEPTPRSFCARRLLPTANGHARARMWRAAAKLDVCYRKGKSGPQAIETQILPERTLPLPHARTHACTLAQLHPSRQRLPPGPFTHDCAHEKEIHSCS